VLQRHLGEVREVARERASVIELTRSERDEAQKLLTEARTEIAMAMRLNLLLVAMLERILLPKD
jgi:hypothetical protein